MNDRSSVQQSLEKELFGHDGDGCEVFVHLRDSKSCGDVRSYLGSLWANFKKSGLDDPEFLRRFSIDCPARIWEMRVASTLSGSGQKVVASFKPGAGMDMGVPLPGGRTVWFEATAPKPGDASLDKVNAPLGQVTYGAEIDRTTALRFLNSIAAKREQYQRATTSGLVGRDDALVIAISGSQLPLADLERPGELPLIAKVLFGIGNTPFIVQVGGGPAANRPSRVGVPLPRPSFRKTSGADVQAGMFLSADAEEVSAVLFDPHHVKNCSEMRGKAVGADVIVVHNPFARIPVLGMLRVGREYANQVGVVDHRPLV